MQGDSNSRGFGLTHVASILAVLFGAVGAAWAQADALSPQVLAQKLAAALPAAGAPPARLEPALQRVLVWQGADVDHDGAPDFANPTGHAVRATDSWGCGGFGAERDGGARDHEGVDFIAAAGQPVAAPISGFVTRIGTAYPDSSAFRFVEITNPALRYVSRVFYVDPQVKEGQAVRLGQPIGSAHSLQSRYPGITDHVHLEIFRAGGPRLDAQRLITARFQLRATAQG